MRRATEIAALRPEDLQRMDRLLDAFVHDAGLEYAVLVDRAGRLLTTAGAVSELDAITFASLAAADFMASSELAMLLGEPEFTALYHHGGDRSLYLTTVGSQAVLAALFDKTTTLGLVRFQYSQLAASFTALFDELSNLTSGVPAMALGENWADEAAGALDLLFAD